jgi:hypothetical protein
MNTSKHFTAILLVAALSLNGCASAPQPPPEAPPLPTSAQAGDTTVVAVASSQPCCPKQTLPEFLGITGLFKLIGGGLDRIRNRLGTLFPGLEAKPPLLAITDPANLAPGSPPAAQAAAEIKAQEDAAPQKIKAIRYLATIGCGGCYPDVEEALLLALDDCTEAVRYEAANAFRNAAGNPCSVCRSSSCCSPRAQKRLRQMAYDTNDQGCNVESSARVRRVARLALTACGPAAPEADPGLPEEGPSAPGVEAAASVLSQPDQPLTMASALASLRNEPMPAGAQGVPSPVAAADSGAVAARVNGEPIYLAEILPRVQRQLREQAGQTSPGRQQQTRPALLRAELHRAADQRLLCQEARRYLPAEQIARVAYVAASTADTSNTAGESFGSTVDDAALADWWLEQNVHISEFVTRAELFAFFRAHLDRYQAPAEVRWEQVTARPGRFASQQQAAQALEVLRKRLTGDRSPTPAEVALEAAEVTTNDWTPRDQLPAGQVGQFLASQPVGQISPVLQDDQGMHLVRVLERREPRWPSLDDVVEDVRRDLLHERYQLAVDDHLRRLRAVAQVWFMPIPEESERIDTSRVIPASHAAPTPGRWSTPSAEPGASGSRPPESVNVGTRATVSARPCPCAEH